MEKIKQITGSPMNTSLLQAILDPSKLGLSCERRNEIDKIGKRLCYSLHCERSILLGVGYVIKDSQKQISGSPAEAVST